MPEAQPEGALAPYRVLDLTEGGCALAAKTLADMGADVIAVEPPGGSPTRNTPPFYGVDPDPERSLFWFTCSLNKRGITLDITSPQGRDLFKRLVARADFLFESFEPGYLDSLGLGYSSLRKLNPGLIMASITPFGQTGPYAHYKGPDIVPWAMGGYMWMCGDPDRPPLRPSIPPQTYFHAAVMSAAASLMALHHRASTGEGQHIDQSAQACGPWMLTHVCHYYEYEGRILKREGQWRQYGPGRVRTVYPCKDGYVVAMVAGGQVAGASLNRLVAWMDREGMAPDWVKEMDWSQYDARTADQELTNRVAEAVGAFFQSKTKKELLHAGVTQGLHLAPVNTARDVVEDDHLKDRGFWRDVEHPELAATLSYPGAPFIATETPWKAYRRPPLIGEHNREVYEEELGLSREEADALRAAGVL